MQGQSPSSDSETAPTLLRGAGKVALALVSLTTFLFGLKLMQSGAQAFGPLLTEHVSLDTAIGAFGFGWVASCLLLSGSPVAAMSLTFFDGGQIDEVAAFSMITGSRLGAAYVVILLGLAYMIGKRTDLRDLRTGLLVLAVTATIYSLAFAIGFFALKSGVFGRLDSLQPPFGEFLSRSWIGQLTDAASAYLPIWATFLSGLGLIIGSFRLFDLSLPRFGEDDARTRGLLRYVSGRWTMFALGAIVTLLSMSVSVSLGLLVPLHDRRILSAGAMVPYIIGANITTFVDTLIAAAAMERGGSVTIVLVEMGSVALISLLVMLLVYRRYCDAVLGSVRWLGADRLRLILFAALSAIVPAALVLVAIAG